MLSICVYERSKTAAHAVSYSVQVWPGQGENAGVQQIVTDCS